MFQYSHSDLNLFLEKMEKKQTNNTKPHYKYKLNSQKLG